MKREPTIHDLPEAVWRAQETARLCHQFCPGSYSSELVFWVGLIKVLVDRHHGFFDGGDR
jgi:hypothetical protein